MTNVILRDGRVAEFRAATQSDADREKLRQLFCRGSDESRYLRFFRVVREVTTADIDRMLQSDGREQFTLICTSEGCAIGVGTYTRSGPDAAEVAFFIADADQGRGIGTLLLEHLADVAIDYGFRQFEAGVLEENRRMQRVFTSSGYEVSTLSRAGVVRMRLPLHQSERTRSLAELREKHAVAASVSPFLEPARVAVVGASRDPDSLGQLILRNLISAAFAGTVYPVNPHATSIAAVKAYPRVQDIPDRIDMAVLVVPAAETLAVVEDCVQAGVGAVVVVSSGFAERSPAGVELQTALGRRLREAGIRLLGPNSLGLVRTKAGLSLNASLVPNYPRTGPLAIASQSGALGIAILDHASKTGIGVSTFVSTGNRADISSNDLLEFWEDDVHAGIVALYLESFGNPRKFSRIARRMSRRKPIVAVKSARSSASLQVSDMNRTALFADDAVVDALFRQTGIIRVDTLPELFDVAALLATMPLPAGPRVAVVTNSTGGAVMAVDALEKYGLRFVGPVLDLGSEAFAQGYGSVLRQLLQDPAVDAVMVVFVPIGYSEHQTVLDAIGTALNQAADADQRKPVVANLLLASDNTVRVADLGPVRLPVYAFPEQAVRALAHVTGYGAYVRQPIGRIPDLPALDIDAARGHVDAARGQALRSDDEIDSLAREQIAQVLAALGVPVIAGSDIAKTALEVITLQATIDPLFGPVLRLTRDTPQQVPWGIERIAPLTDMDCDVMIRAALGRDFACHDALRDLMLRVSRLVDEIVAIAGFVLPVRVLANRDGAPTLAVALDDAKLWLQAWMRADRYRD